MDFKEFGENAEIEYTTIVSVNGIEAGKITALSEESLLEDFRKLDHAISEELQRQFEDLPEPIEDEDRGLSDEN